MLVSTTDSHIKRGIKGSCCDCPVALAMKESGLMSPSVSSRFLYFDWNGKRHVADTPEHVATWIYAFDNYKDVEPFGFELEAPCTPPSA